MTTDYSSKDERLPFYDEQMAEIVDHALKYLQTPRGQAAMRKHAAAAKEFADTLRKAHEIPWEKLHEPFTI